MSRKSAATKRASYISSNTSKYRVFDPRHQRVKWTGITIARLVIMAAWLTAIALGAQESFVVMQDKHFLGLTVTVDTQLALLGVVNKLLDVLVLTSLQDLSHVLILLWMMAGKAGKSSSLVGRGTGARPGDLEIFDELSKPWKACSAFWTRWRSQGWRHSGPLRFVAGLTISICVMLQGFAINLLGVPKDRWFPSEQYNSKLTLDHPSARIQSIDQTFWGQGFDIVGGGRYSWEAAGAFSTAGAYRDLQSLAPQFSHAPPQWRNVGSDGPDTVTLDTTYDGTSPMRGYVVQSAIAQDIFHWSQVHGPPQARAAMGWIIRLRMIVPTVSVTCIEAETSMLEVESVVVDKVSTNTSSFTLSTRKISFDDRPNATFPSVRCSIDFSRAVVPVWSWLKDNGTVDVDPDAYVNSDTSNEIATNLPLAAIDTYLADQVRIQLVLITSRFESLMAGVNAASLLARNALRLRSVRPEIRTDVAALAPAVALITAHVLAHSSWNYTLDTDHMLTSTSVRWQLLAAGPYFRWQWTAVIILAVLALATLAGIGLSLATRFSGPDFLTPGGILIAANASEQLPLLKNKTLNSDDKVIENQTLFLGQISVATTAGEPGRISIVQEHNRQQHTAVDGTRALHWF